MAGPLIRRRDFRAVPLLRRKLPGTRLGARINPEANPVLPGVPGTRDIMDLPFRIPAALRKELDKNADEIDKLQREVDSSLRLGGDPIKRGRIRELLKRNDKLLSRLFEKRV